MTSASDYKAYTKTREYKNLPFKARMRLAWAEEKRQWNERGWFYRIGICCIIRPFILIPLTLAVVLCMWVVAGLLIVAGVIFEMLCHWQAYAMIGLVIAIIMLVHFGII